jgi:hypothetical protein
LHPCGGSHEFLQLLTLNVDDQKTFFLTDASRCTTGWGWKMVKVLQYEKADEHGKPIKCFMKATAVTTC